MIDKARERRKATSRRVEECFVGVCCMLSGTCEDYKGDDCARSQEENEIGKTTWLSSGTLQPFRLLSSSHPLPRRVQPPLNDQLLGEAEDRINPVQVLVPQQTQAWTNRGWFRQSSLKKVHEWERIDGPESAKQVWKTSTMFSGRSENPPPSGSCRSTSRARTSADAHAS